MPKRASNHRRRSIVGVAFAGFVCFTLLGDCFAVTLHLLPIGDPGNAVDPRPGAHIGSVPYTYYLDKYDVTNTQYVEFLNAKASSADPFGLYDSQMADFANGGITRSVSAPFSYSVKSGMANKPVVYVSWYNALRFTNWLTNGQGDGDTEGGSYQITNGGANAGTVVVPTAEQRAAWVGTSLHYLLPSKNEWYKAGIYKGGGQNAGYLTYPFGNGQPPNSGPPGTFRGANILGLFGDTALPGPVFLTDVGAYDNPGPYGQMDMGGNVAQLTDTPLDFDPTQITNRGGGWNTPAINFQGGGGASPGVAINFIGFRVMMVPEPASLTLAALAALGVLAWRCGKRRG